MSQFNNPQGGYQQPGKPGQPYPPYQPYQPVQQPQKSGGSNTVLIILAIVGGLLFLAVASCGVMAWVISNSVTEMMDEFSGVATTAMAEELVSQYEEKDEIKSKIGRVEDFHMADEDQNFLEVLTARKVVIILEGENGEGELVLYQKNQRPEKVTFVFNGEEITLDDDPVGFDNWDEDTDWDSSDWDEEESGPGFGEEEFADEPAPATDTTTDSSEETATEGSESKETSAAEGDQ